MKKIFLTSIVGLIFASIEYSQVPIAVGIQILKAEDARRYDSVIEGLLRSPNLAVRERAALAAGRVGDDRAIEPLAEMFGDKRNAGRVWTMAVFAIGEIESVKGAGHIMDVIKSESGYVKRDAALLSRAFEAAGKIAAANPKDPAAKELGEVILKGLEFEQNSASPSAEVIRRGVTAVMRSRPADGDKAIRPFLAHSDPEVVADTLNALTRLRSKNANRDARDLLETSVHALIRANAARLLGAAEDKEAFNALLKAATTDQDSRVRVSAIRSLASLKDAKAADNLIARGNELLIPTQTNPTSIEAGKTIGRRKAAEANLLKSELLEIAVTIGRLLQNTKRADATNFLGQLFKADGFRSGEVGIALVRITNEAFSGPFNTEDKDDIWKSVSSMAQMLGELSSVEDKGKRSKNEEFLKESIMDLSSLSTPTDVKDASMFAPELLRAYASYKPSDLSHVLQQMLKNNDLFIRAAAAELLAVSTENVAALQKAFDRSLITDKHDNDAQLAILNALAKLDKKASVGTFMVALSAPDYLVRKRAFAILSDKDLQKDFPGIPTSLENARAKHKDQVLPYSPAFGTKLGQVLNTDADYRRALSRKNGTVKAVLATEKGSFTIVFNPEEAPLTVDNWVKLARSGYFNGLEVHRVVPNFVMQDGDPRGDGNGGPGWSIRCEINMLPFDRGAVGMALSGKDTGGSQWFLDHSPQPHLDGGYTVFGHVDEAGMKVVDQIVRGDKILNVKIVEAASMPGPARRK